MIGDYVNAMGPILFLGLAIVALWLVGTVALLILYSGVIVASRLKRSVRHAKP